MPLPSDLHVNQPLTSILHAYLQDQSEFIADRVFPRVPVAHVSDLYWKIEKDGWFRADARERAPGTESSAVTWKATTDGYFCRLYAVHHDIDDQLRANADSVFALDRIGTELVSRHLLLQREQQFVQAYFRTGVWGTDYTGVAGTPTGDQFKQWDAAGSDPIRDVDTWRRAIKIRTGFSPNVLVMGREVYDALKNHAVILDRYKYTTGGSVTRDVLARLFEVDEILVPEVVQNQVTEGTAASYQYLYGKKLLFCHRASSPGMMVPSAGYVFVYTGLLGGEAFGARIKRFRIEPIASDRIEGEIAYDMKVVAPDLAIFADQVVS